MSGIRTTKSRKARETLTDPTDITHDPYCTIIDSYSSEIDVADAVRSGTLKKIYNDSGSTVSLIFNLLQGASSQQLDMLDNTWVELIFISEADEGGASARYRVIDGSLTGLTLV